MFKDGRVISAGIVSEVVVVMIVVRTVVVVVVEGGVTVVKDSPGLSLSRDPCL